LADAELGRFKSIWWVVTSMAMEDSVLMTNNNNFSS